MPIEIPLTDEVAPDLTTPPSRPFPIVTILLLLISVGAVAAAFFFYQQSRSLGQQLTEIERIQQQQKIKENQTIFTPTPAPTLELSPTGTISATLTITPTPAPVSGTVFGTINSVIATATAKYGNAQLLMITVSAAENPATAITKYWFRQTETDKRYLYILSEPSKDLALVDQQVYVTPDNTIPSLNRLAAAGQLGLDLPEALTIAAAACPPNFSCHFTPFTARYIKPVVTLCRITYNPPTAVSPLSSRSTPPPKRSSTKINNFPRGTISFTMFNWFKEARSQGPRPVIRRPAYKIDVTDQPYTIPSQPKKRATPRRSEPTS